MKESILSRRALAVALSLVALGACAPRTTPAPPAPSPFDFARLADSVVATPPLHRAHIGIQVYDPEARRVLYAHNAQRHFVPASNQKYWPSATALELLGPEWRYRTPILGIGVDPAAGTARALVVVGRGDPTWSARFHDHDFAVLNSLADSVVAAGVLRITGDLIVDASYFDESIVPGTWTFGNLNGTSAPPSGAFAVAEGVMALVAQPGDSVGSPVRVTPRAPEGLVPLANRVTTGEAGTGRRIAIARGPWSDTLRLSGTLGADAEAETVRLPVTDPVRFASLTLVDALRERGVVVEGNVRVVRDSAEAAAVREGRLGLEVGPVTELTSWTSPPMSEIVAAILMPSQNWIAEQLVRTLGAEKGGGGSWREGAAVQMAFLTGTVGIDSAALSLQDGSGMSHQNLVTPEAVVQLLDHARTATWGEAFRAALAAPGRPGTLNSRLRELEGRVAGKTGTLSNVNALSGYVLTREGRELIFAIVSNASGLPGAPVVSAVDRLVEALANGPVPGVR